MKKRSPEISVALARRLLLDRQGLRETAPFGTGSEGAFAAIRRLGYIQIDTIFVVERAHHHILWSRVPGYLPSDLARLQSEEKRIFEHWTHALSYIPTEDFRFFVRGMRAQSRVPSGWFANVKPNETSAMLHRIAKEGPLSMRDIAEERQEKVHEWASRKPSKRVLEHLFYAGRLAVSRREGMLKHYELLERHFGWERAPRAASLREEAAYRIDRTLGAQSVITLDSTTYLERDLREEIGREIARRTRAGSLVAVTVPDAFPEAFITPENLAHRPEDFSVDPDRITILSPFDPLIIQRKRTRLLFGLDYVLECYVPEAKRKHGYFVLPILAGENFVARLDLKAHRDSGRLETKAWHWERGVTAKKVLRRKIEERLAEFALFQFGTKRA
jgi:uncharacterized protein YcaQ